VYEGECKIGSYGGKMEDVSLSLEVAESFGVVGILLEL